MNQSGPIASSALPGPAAGGVERARGEDAMEEPWLKTGDPDLRVRSVAFWLAIFVTAAAIVMFAHLVITTAIKMDWTEILRDHCAAIFGLPGAVATAFIIVIFLRQADGPIEFEALGFKFKGAAGQVVMWVLCFLAIAAALKLVW
jgi:hypothetical protein